MRRLSFLFAICMIINFCACSSSSDEDMYYLNCAGSGNDPSTYELISGVSSSDIKLLCYNKVYTNSDSSDSLLVFTGVKNNKLWVEGYHSDTKNWLSSTTEIRGRKLPWNVNKTFSWVDNQDIDREIRYRSYDGNIKVDSLIKIIPSGIFCSKNEMAISYAKDYGYSNNVIFGIKFLGSGKTIESKLTGKCDITNSPTYSFRVGYCYWWGNDYILISLYNFNTNGKTERTSDCYTVDGQYQFSCTTYPGNLIGISRECGLDKSWPMKVNIVDGTTIWSITEEQICQKLGLILGEKDKLVVSYDSKESETVYVYNVKVQWDDLYKGDENYKIRVNVDTGELL